ncbi:MAG: glycosyl hydrolase, partial [bacterium]|nr:glycosyl hydrolase [bacterium]
MDATIFVNPPIDYRIVPFWFWNSALDEGEIVRQIHEMAEKGIGGFCLSARPGLRIPYLSNAWFDRVDIAVKAAKEHGLQVWLHDEFPSPGSLSGERVALGFPQYRAQYLTFRETTVQGGQQVDIELPWSTVLRAVAVPLRRDRCLWENAEDIGEYIGLCQRREIFQETKDKNAYHAHRYLGQDMAYRLYWKAPAGRWRVLVFMQRAFEPPEFSGASFDPYNAEAVAHFLETSCQPYADRLGDAFGKTIPALLTSEATAPGNPLPWTALLPGAFLERNQYDLLNCLPALITSFGPNTARIRYDYFQTLSELLRDNFHKTCADWCADRKISYASTVAPLRSAHRSGLQIPGTSGEKGKVDAPPVRDGGPQAASYRHSPRFTTSVAHQNGSARTLNTCFQDAGWSLTLQDMKWTVDRLAARGCNLFNFHAFFYTLDGLRKHDSPPSQFQQNPFWKNFRLISDYTARLSYALTLGKRTPTIAILDPVTSLWSHLGHLTRDWAYVG